MSKSGRGWDSESVEKSRLVCNLVFQCWKQSYKMTIKSNLTPVQRHIINELKKDGLIIICFLDKGKAVMVEDILVNLIAGIIPNYSAG